MRVTSSAVLAVTKALRQRQVQVVLGIGALSLAALVLPQVGSQSPATPARTPTPAARATPGGPLPPVDPSGLIPTPSTIVDLAPQTANADKATVIVRHQDGRYEQILVPPTDVDRLVKTLPPR